MCPYFNPNRKECKVTPWDSSAHQSDRDVEYKCSDNNNYKNCGNYEAAQRGDYKIER